MARIPINQLQSPMLEWCQVRGSLILLCSLILLVYELVHGATVSKGTCALCEGGKKGSVTELEEVKGREARPKKLNILSETENAAQHQASGKIHRKRRLGKDSAGEQLLKPHKKKKG